MLEGEKLLDGEWIRNGSMIVLKLRPLEVARDAGKPRIALGRLVPRVRVASVVELARERRELERPERVAHHRQLVVSATPSDFSARPGCGPCGRPDGWSVIDPTSIAFREPKLPET